jgi:hypothetical protein
MRKGTDTPDLSRKLRWSFLGSGVTTFAVLESCDPAISNAVLVGLEDLSVSLIQAFFTSIAPEASSSVTVQVITDTVGGILC